MLKFESCIICSDEWIIVVFLVQLDYCKPQEPSPSGRGLFSYQSVTKDKSVVVGIISITTTTKGHRQRACLTALSNLLCKNAKACLRIVRSCCAISATQSWTLWITRNSKGQVRYSKKKGPFPMSLRRPEWMMRIFPSNASNEIPIWDECTQSIINDQMIACFQSSHSSNFRAIFVQKGNIRGRSTIPWAHNIWSHQPIVVSNEKIQSKNNACDPVAQKSIHSHTQSPQWRRYRLQGTLKDVGFLIRSRNRDR